MPRWDNWSGRTMVLTIRVARWEARRLVHDTRVVRVSTGEFYSCSDLDATEVEVSYDNDARPSMKGSNQ